MLKKLLYILGLISLLISPLSSMARDVSLAKNNLLLTPTHGGDGSAWGQENCLACHVKRNIHRTPEGQPIRDIVLKTGFASCTGCHGQNGTSAKRQCVLCHNPRLLPKKPIMNEIRNHNFTVLEDTQLSDEQCITCHRASDMDKKFEPAVDLTHFKKEGIDLPYKKGTEFCLACHNENHQQPEFKIKSRFKRDPLVMMATNYQYIDVHGFVNGTGQRTYAGLREGYQYASMVECTDCHAMHGTHNKKLIVDRSDAGMMQLTSDLRSQPIWIDIGQNGDYSQLCVSCHQMQELVEQGFEDAGNGLAGAHQIGTDCRACHKHGMAAQTGL